MNLLSNAVKCTPQGGAITLRAWLAAGSLHMAVQDTGVGMGAETLSLLFQRFQQAERSQGGSGLGLFITKRIVDAMSGHITYQSAPGRGTTALVSVPVEALPVVCPPAEAARTDGPSRQRRLARPLHVLIAEDNDVNRRILARFLEDLGCTYDAAADGAEAVAKFRAHQGAIDACLLDLRMPVMDGIEATRAIRDIARQQNRCAQESNVTPTSLHPTNQRTS